MFDFCSYLVSLLFVRVDVYKFDIGAAEQFETVFETVFLGIDYALDACLDDELGTFDAGGGGDVEGGAFAAVARPGYLGDGVGFGVEHVGDGQVVVVLAYVLEAGGGAVVAVGDDHLVFYDQCSYLTAFTV